MITAVDSSVLLDIFLEHPKFAQASADALRSADAVGSLTICGIVYAELCSCFGRKEILDGALARLDITVKPFDRDMNFAAGRAFRAYREKGGARARILPDFLVGPHAQARAAQLLTRDRGFYRAYFRKLKIVDPTAGSKV